MITVSLTLNILYKETPNTSKFDIEVCFQAKTQWNLCNRSEENRSVRMVPIWFQNLLAEDKGEGMDV